MCTVVIRRQQDKHATQMDVDLEPMVHCSGVRLHILLFNVPSDHPHIM